MSITMRWINEETLSCSTGNDTETRALRHTVRDFNILHSLGRPVTTATGKDDVRITGIAARLGRYLELVQGMLAEAGVYDVILPPRNSGAGNAPPMDAHI